MCKNWRGTLSLQNGSRQQSPVKIHKFKIFLVIEHNVFVEYTSHKIVLYSWNSQKIPDGHFQSVVYHAINGALQNKLPKFV